MDRAGSQDDDQKPDRPSRVDSRRRGLLGELLVKEGLITETQLEEALRLQRDSEPQTPLGQVLVNRRLITQKQLTRVLHQYHRKYRLGDILVETETITEEQLQIALGHQKKTGLRLGDVLLQLNFVTDDEISRALSTQFGLTLVDLDRLIIDQSAANVVDKSFAQQHRVIPITKSDNTMVLAMDDPSDLAVVAELEASMGCRISVVTSTHSAFRRAFTRAYGASPEEGLAGQYEELKTAHESLREEHTKALAELETAHEALRQQRAEAVEALRELGERHAAVTQSLAELQAAHEALLGEHAANTQALRELREAHEATLREREYVATQLEAVLRRLKP